MYIASTLGSAFGLIALGTYMMLKSWDYEVTPYNWIPLVSFLFVILFASSAILTLPFTIIGEIMPENIKDFGVAFCNTILSSIAAIVLKTLPFLTELLGFHGSMFLFGGICLSGTVFIIFYVPETKGKSYEQIQKSLQ